MLKKISLIVGGILATLGIIGLTPEWTTYVGGLVGGLGLLTLFFGRSKVKVVQPDIEEIEETIELKKDLENIKKEVQEIETKKEERIDEFEEDRKSPPSLDAARDKLADIRSGKAQRDH